MLPLDQSFEICSFIWVFYDSTSHLGFTIVLEGVRLGLECLLWGGRWLGPAPVNYVSLIPPSAGVVLMMLLLSSYELIVGLARDYHHIKPTTLEFLLLE